MSATVVEDPFGTSPLGEVHLPNSPLAAVLFQVRLPRPYTRLQDAIQRETLATELSDIYPYAETQDVWEVVFQAGKDPQQMPSGSKALSMSDASQAWTMTVTRDSLALTTTNYQDRADLLARARVIFQALDRTAPPPRIARIGVRYINRITDLERFETLIDDLVPTVQPVQRFSYAGIGAVKHCMNDLLYAWEGTGERLQARWGFLSAGQVVDGSLPPVNDGPSWVLDIDAFDETSREFTPDTLVNELEALTEKAYRFFRWIFTPNALVKLGASE